ncbi:MAG TPA: segregation/condensation protein A [Verrucomicrobiae bacterium]|nr:segregation/condensation protein A [Verrucomicrobiae bacterium]
MQEGATQELLLDTGQAHYKVRLESFEGPLDLLLHLIRKNEVSIYDIPIFDITRQYLEHLQLMKELNLEIAGDFLVMASTLLQIKSRMLLPTPSEDVSEEEEEDPRTELVRRLLEYTKYREAGLELERRNLLGREVFARTFLSAEVENLAEEEAPADVDLFLLVDAFRTLLARAPREVLHEVTAETVNIADRMTSVLEAMQQGGAVSFLDLFPEGSTRHFIVATFLAVLELCRLRMLKVMQNEQHGTIWLTPAVGEPQEDPDA